MGSRAALRFMPKVKKHKVIKLNVPRLKYLVFLRFMMWLKGITIDLGRPLPSKPDMMHNAKLCTQCLTVLGFFFCAICLVIVLLGDLVFKRMHRWTLV